MLRQKRYLTVGVFCFPMVTVELPIFSTWTSGLSGISAGLSMSNAKYARRKEFCESHGCGWTISARPAVIVVMGDWGTFNTVMTDLGF
jgi:hypothetical protein